MTITYDCTEETGREVGLSSASGALRAGRLVVTPTDTLYGIAADAFDPDAVNLLLSAKRRGPDMPVPVLVGSWETIDGLVVSTPAAARDLIRAFWPGGLSLIVHQAPSLGWNLGHTQGTVMLRMPLHPVAIKLLREVGPLAVSSANVSGQPPATTVVQAREQLGDSVAVYLDGGPCSIGRPSTIVDLTGPGPRIVREGAVTAERVGEVLDIDPAQLRG
ncbi:L-threonylcarbamoyladenylate synthase [uncultured Dietzia sp.]|uniref:L-threonylcarbamoyladenylate synthase n=1 Tax=uncultured Dietzia sp. TaxID=395519 RepID=UPI0025E96E83|nr:L-threonylcarbamoyladenylate synthase [uncultured Dietzia sp.]